MKQKIRTSPDLSPNSIDCSKNLINNEKWGSWLYNVQDRYKSMSVSDIKEDLVSTALPSAILMAQIEGDFNFGNIIRTSNAYNLHKVYYYGRKRYDRRGCVGTTNYTDVTYLNSLDEIVKLKSMYTFVGLENNLNKPSININNYKWNLNSLIVIGEEKNGISNDIISLCDDILEIKLYGSVRSLNAATAAAIAIDKLSSQFR